MSLEKVTIVLQQSSVLSAKKPEIIQKSYCYIDSVGKMGWLHCWWGLKRCMMGDVIHRVS